MRYLILLVALVAACSNASKADPAPTSRNFVCERMKELDAAATCEPEYTDAGEGLVHTARVTQKGKPTVSCGLSAGQLGMVCGPLVAQETQPAEPKNSGPPPSATK